MKKLLLLSLALGLTASAAEKVFQETGGLLVMQAESGPLVSPWAGGSKDGASYRTWAGQDVTKWPSATEDYPYRLRFVITKPGRYNFAVRNWIVRPYSSFFAQLDGASQASHHFSFQKAGAWNWNTWVDTGSGHHAAYFDLKAGTHTLAFKGRTGKSGYLMDRFHLYLASTKNPLSLSWPESPSSGVTSGPAPPPPPPPGPPPPSPPVTPDDPHVHPPAPTDGPFYTVNDDSPILKYSGLMGWHDAKGAGRFNGDEHYTKRTGASVELKFEGTQIRWLATRFSNRGFAEVYIDGSLAATVDLYAPVAASQQGVFVKTGLHDGPHTIKVVCKGTKRPASTGNFIDVDAFRFQ